MDGEHSYKIVSKDTRYPEILEHINYDKIREEHFLRTGQHIDDPKELAKKRYDEELGSSLMDIPSDKYFGVLTFNPIEAILELLDEYIGGRDESYYLAARRTYFKLDDEQKEYVDNIVKSVYGVGVLQIKRIK